MNIIDQEQKETPKPVNQYNEAFNSTFDIFFPDHKADNEEFMEIEPRPFAGILDETYCPEDQAVGCRRCDGIDECEERAHKDHKCFDDCPICNQESTY